MPGEGGIFLNGSGAFTKGAIKRSQVAPVRLANYIKAREARKKLLSQDYEFRKTPETRFPMTRFCIMQDPQSMRSNGLCRDRKNIFWLAAKDFWVKLAVNFF